MSAKKSARDTRARERAAQLRAAQERAARRRRAGWVAAIVVGVLIAAAVIGLAVYQSNRPSTSSNFAVPEHNSSSLGIEYGKASAPVTVDLYEDFQCPVCQQFEKQVGPEIEQLVDQGTIKVVFHPLAFLDRMSSGTEYSTRSSAASGCAADAGVFPKYANVLFANQPPEGGHGLTNDRLVELGRQVGATSDTFAQCVKNQKYAEWTQAVTEKATERGVNATPTVYVDGQELPRDQYDPDGFKQAVQDAAQH